MLRHSQHRYIVWSQRGNYNHIHIYFQLFKDLFHPLLSTQFSMLLPVLDLNIAILFLFAYPRFIYLLFSPYWMLFVASHPQFCHISTFKAEQLHWPRSLCMFVQFEVLILMLISQSSRSSSRIALSPNSLSLLCHITADSQILWPTWPFRSLLYDPMAIPLACTGPSLWNGTLLPYALPSSLFFTQLKTFLFSKDTSNWEGFCCDERLINDQIQYKY